MKNSFQITNEQKLVLALSKPFYSRNLGLTNCIFNLDEMDWDEIDRLSEICEIPGLLFKNAKGLNLLPEDLSSKFGSIYHKTALATMQALQETLEILKFMGDHQISAIPLKGAFAAEFVFEDLGVYHFCDIDVLIPPALLSTAEKLLCEHLNYQPLEGYSRSDLKRNHYHLILKKRMVLEIHWNLVKRYFNIPAEFWWKTSNKIEWNNIPAIDLSIENHILYYVFRLFDHCFFPLRFFVLLAGTLEKNADKIDWNLLLQTARLYRMERLLLYTLRVTGDLLSSPLPHCVTNVKLKGYTSFRALVLSGIFTGVDRKHIRMLFYTLILTRPSTAIKVVLGRLFPSKGEIRLRYNLPSTSKKVYLYLLLNPLLLFLNSRKENDLA